MPAARRIPVLRAALVLLGAAGAAWGATTFPPRLGEVPINALAREIVNGEPFSIDSLLAFEPSLRAAEEARLSTAAVRRSDAIIHLHMLEVATLEGRRRLMDEQMASLQGSLEGALSWTPTDGYLWLVLFTTRNARIGFRPEHLELLRMSYELTPNEAWIAAKRSHVALALFRDLPVDLAQRATHELVRLLESGQHELVADLVLGPGLHVRDTLLAEIIPNISREQEDALDFDLRQRGQTIRLSRFRGEEAAPVDPAAETDAGE